LKIEIQTTSSLGRCFPTKFHGGKGKVAPVSMPPSSVLVTYPSTTRRHNPEHFDLNLHRGEELRSHNSNDVSVP